MANVIPLTSESAGERERPLVVAAKTCDVESGPINVGLELCRARQRCGKTLMDISNQTKIAPHHLMAMERNRFDALPGRVYAVGFVRNYAACVGLDSEALVARVKAEFPEPDAPLPVATILPPQPRKAPEAEFVGKNAAQAQVVSPLSPRERKWPQAATAAVLVTAAAVYATSFLLYYREQVVQPSVRSVPSHLLAEAGEIEAPVAARTSAEPVPPHAPTEIAHSEPATLDPETPSPAPPAPSDTSPREGQPTPAPIPQLAAVEPRPAVVLEPPAAALPSPSPAAETNTEVASDTAPTPPAIVRPKPKPPISARSKAAPASSAKSVVATDSAHEFTRDAASPASTVAGAKPVSLTAVTAPPTPRLRGPLPLGHLYGTQNKDARIILRVHRPMHLAVSGPGSVTIFNRILDPGDTYRVPNITGLKLTASDAGAVEIILDDTTVGFASQDGAVARGLPLDPQSIIDRKNPS